MELTVDQALQQGVAAHKEGKLEEAERLYRAILQSQPLHPDANHNLGVLAVSLNKSDAALPLFKTALEANPKIGQFWISYIDALIKENQFQNAEQVVEQGKNAGLVAETVDALSQQLMSATYSAAPSQEKLNSLLGHYKNGRFDDAEKSAISITQQFPIHQFSWKILGAVLKQTNRISEALVANQKSVELSPQDAEAHYNLGNTQKELGRLAEAEASYRKVIAVKPDFAKAHSNLGVALQELGRLGEAEASHRQVIILQPDFAEAHYNLGNTLKELGKLAEAEASLRQSIALKPSYDNAHNNLGIILYEIRQYKKAVEQFKLSEFRGSEGYLLQCFYQQDERSFFYDQLDYLISQGEVNAMIGSLTSRSEIRYGIKRSNIFAREPLKYVLKTDLTEQCDFNSIFIKIAKDILNNGTVSYKRQDHLTNGYQTAGNLFAQNSDLMDGLKKIIHSEIEKYRVLFQASEEGFLRNWPRDYNLFGWLVSMKSGGELAPHIHETGWISGVIYIHVPRKQNTDNGNLVVCIDEEKPTGDGEGNPHEIIDVVTGTLVLFPASLMHYTIPFESEEERIVLAFDVLPN